MSWRDLPVAEAGVAVVITGVMLGAAPQSGSLSVRPVDAVSVGVAGSGNSAGAGLRGMAERVGAPGGDLVAAEASHGELGFGGQAWLPGRAR